MELHANFLGETNATDFVIKRRRTRHAAVDPCLGFYSLRSPIRRADPHLTLHVRDFHPDASTINHTSEYSSELLSSIQPDQPLGPTAAVQSSPYESDIHGKPRDSSDSHFPTPSDHKPTNASSPIQIPVDEFLRRTASKIHVKYGRRKRRAKSPEAYQEVEDSGDESFSPRPLKRYRSRIVNNRASTPFCPSPSNHKKSKTNAQPHNRNKKVKSLAERLIKASVLSHGSPAECLLNPDLLNPTLHPCPPIDFVPDTQSSGPPPRRAWTLVDPKKAAPFRSASFRARARQEPSTTTATRHRPLSKWMETRNAVEGQSSSKKLIIKRRLGAQARKTAVDPLRCPPLVLVSLQDAEAAYSRSKRDNKADIPRINQTTQTPVSCRQNSGDVARPPLLFVSEQASSRPVTPLSLHASRFSHTLKTPASPIQHRGTFLDINTESIEQETCLDASESDENVSCGALEDNQVLSNLLTNLVPQTQTQTLDATSPGAQLSITPPETVTRPLKPLGSFFDGFRERGRATMKAAENVATTKRSSSSSDISISHRKNTIPIPAGDVLGSLRSFVRTSLRNGPSIIPCQSRLPMFLQPPDALMVEPFTPGRKRRPVERILPKVATPATETHIPDALKSGNAHATPCNNRTIISEPQPLSNEHSREPYMKSFSSANILSVLEPQPYQIVLCSPSSSPVISRPRSSFAHHAPSDINMVDDPPIGTFDDFGSSTPHLFL